MLETGWLEGIDGGWPERSFAERPGLNFRVAVGDEVVQGAKLAERPT